MGWIHDDLEEFVRAKTTTVGILMASQLVLWPSLAMSQPWESRCKAALDDIGTAREDSQRARRSIESSYERFKNTRDDYNTCRLHPEIYDLLKDQCRSKLSAAESAKSQAESDLSTFNSRLETLFNAVENVGSVCSSERAQPGRASARVCRLIATTKRGSTEEQTLGVCKNLGVTEAECRRCMQ